MAAIILPAVLGTAGFGFDVGYWYLTKRNFQGAADAAAISGAVAYASGNLAGYITEARAAAAQHGATHGQNATDVSVTFPYADGTAACPAGNGDCLQVQVSQAQSPMLARLVGQGSLTVAAQSVAKVSHQTYCMLATNSSNSNVNNVTGIDLSLFFIGLLNMPNCSIASNWLGPKSLELDGFGFVGLTAYTATLMGQFDLNCFCFPGPQWTHPIKQNAVAPFAPIADPYLARTVPQLAPVINIQPQAIPAIPANCQAAIIASRPPVNSGANNCYKGVNLVANSNANVTFNAGNYTIYGITLPNTTTLTLNAGNYAIYGQAGKVAISVSGGTLTLKSGNHTIVGWANEPAISVSSGTATLTTGNGTTYIEAGSAQPAIGVTGGTLNINVNGPSSSIIDILGGLGQPAITVGAGGTAGSFTLGDGNSNIQAGSNNVSAITLAGNGSFTALDNTNGTGVVIGAANPATYGINVATGNPGCGLGFACAHDLTLGAGTYQIMGGIQVTGGNLTLNPAGANIGTYIMDGGGGTCPAVGGAGSNVGLCMTAGDLNGRNSTIVLTGSALNYATFSTPQNFNFDGINLTAPQSGPTAGLAIFQDRNAPANGSNTAFGVSFLRVTGALYFPAQSLNFVGVTVDVNNTCLQLIANTLSITGLAFIDDQCPAGVSPIVGIGTGMASLVE